MTISKNYNIKWKRSDYIKLGRAVSDFNKKINRLEQEEKRLYLPEVQNYQEVKENITTRSELNRVINSLKRFGREGAEDLYVTEAGEQLTSWEFKELNIQKRSAVRRLKTELKELNTPAQGQKFSRVQMGSERADEIQAELSYFSKLQTKKGYEFQRLQDRIKKIGTSDYTLKKAYTFRENFMKELEELKNNSPEFQLVYDKFEKIRNPITFFNTTQKSNALQDFFVWYKTPENYAGFKNSLDLANYIVEEYEL